MSKKPTELMSMHWGGRAVAWIDSDGNFTCKNKRLMVKALKGQANFWFELDGWLKQMRKLLP